MDITDRLLRMLRAPFATRRAQSGDDRERDEPDVAEDHQSEGEEDFHAMLVALGSEPEDPRRDEAENRLRIAEATIDELRSNLERLRPLGEELAEAEQARRDLLAELESVRTEPEAEPGDADLRAELARVQRLLAQRDRRVTRLTDRLERLRVRYEDRNRTASDRWRELVRLRRENRELKKRTRG